MDVNGSVPKTGQSSLLTLFHFPPTLPLIRLHDGSQWRPEICGQLLWLHISTFRFPHFPRAPFLFPIIQRRHGASTFIPQSGTTAGQAGVFRAGMVLKKAVETTKHTKDTK
jgi:hypothetical protein